MFPVYPVVLSKNVGASGATVSRMMSSVVSEEIFHRLSLNLIYTVLIPSGVLRLFDRAVLHDCRFVGLAEFQNATCTHPTHASVAQTVLNVTVAHVVYIAPVFIENDHHVGAFVST